MKTSVVPAQVTTIEDRIAGRLGLSQLMLLAVPVFGGSALYIILPPNMHSATYKLVVIVSLLLVCSILAIRIKEKILLLWLVVLVRYNLRPRYYVANKNSLAGRNLGESAKDLESEEETTEIEQVNYAPLPSLSIAEALRVQAVMENPATNLSFIANKKGGLHVVLTEVPEQG
jgi:hypothetical protein